MVNPGKLTIAVEWDDGYWYLARVEKLDRRAHVVAFGGEGGDYSKLRLIGYKGEMVRKFVFLLRRSSVDESHGTPFQLFF